MKLSISDLRTIILNLPDAKTSEHVEILQNTVCLNDDGTVHPTNIRRIIFQKNSNNTDWDMTAHDDIID